MQDIQKRGLNMPLLIRFSDILADRIARLNECFVEAIREYDYPGVYKGVYPVKVNQQRHVVEEVVEFGRPFQFGLEAGSKPELLIALATPQDARGADYLQRLQRQRIHRDGASGPEAGPYAFCGDRALS